MDVFKKKTLLLICFATIVRFFLAGFIHLGNDEVYYRMYAQYLQWNYFDHPPMVGWIIRATTLNLLLDNDFFIRIGAIASAGFTTWLIFLCGKKLQSSYTGFLAAIIYTATIYGSIIAGTFILPDAPQMICWSAGLLVLLHIVQSNKIKKSSKKNMLLFGIVVGIGMLCKIHSIFLWFGFLGYAIFYNRKWFLEPSLYIAGFFTLILFYPVIQWNINNHFATYHFHSQRVAIASAGIDILSFVTFFTGQIFYYNPIIFIFMAIAVFAVIRNKTIISSNQKHLLLFCSIPLIIICSVTSLFKTMLPHWTAPSYIGIVLLTAMYFSNKKATGIGLKNYVPKPLVYALGLLAAIIFIGTIVVNFYPGTLGKKEKSDLGEGDFTLDLYGWKNLQKNFEKIADSATKKGEMKADAAIICNKWFPAAHIDKYVAMPLHKKLIAIGDTNDIHQYAWINNSRGNLKYGDDAYCIVPSNYYEDVKKNYGKYFKTILPVIIIEQKRGNKVCRYFYIWRLKSYFDSKNNLTIY